MTESITRCNGCRKVKGETNHWIAMERRCDRHMILPTLTIYAFEDCGPDFEHYCSPVCAGKRFNEFLDDLRERSIKRTRQNAEDESQENEPDVHNISEVLNA